jgi:ketosteroid isomerase-like protein
MMNRPSNDTERQLLDLSQQWVAAELRGDTAFLDRTLVDDFIGVGPLGFLLSKQDWLQRYRSGDFVYQTLALEDMQVRDYGQAAVLIGTQAQHATYRDQVMQGRFRITLVWVRQAERWLLVGCHLSGPIPDGPPRRG